MGTTVEQLDALLMVRSEDEHLEFKAAENRYDFEELVDYCVALANEGGRAHDPRHDRQTAAPFSRVKGI